MAKGIGNIASRVEEAIRAPLAAEGFEVWDVEYVKEGSEWYLRITVDAPNGVDIDDCEKAFRLIDPIVTEMDPVEGAYHLEVSSPGLERELRLPGHFKACLGQEIVVKLFKPVGAAREWKGTLKAVEENGAILLACPQEVRIEKQNVARAHVYFDFDAAAREIEEADLAENDFDAVDSDLPDDANEI